MLPWTACCLLYLKNIATISKAIGIILNSNLDCPFIVSITIIIAENGIIDKHI